MLNLKRTASGKKVWYKQRQEKGHFIESNCKRKKKRGNIVKKDKTKKKIVGIAWSKEIEIYTDQPSWN